MNKTKELAGLIWVMASMFICTSFLLYAIVSVMAQLDQIRVGFKKCRIEVA